MWKDAEVGLTVMIVVIWGALLTWVGFAMVQVARHEHVGQQAEQLVEREFPEGYLVSDAVISDKGLFAVDVVTDGTMLHCLVDVAGERVDCFER